MDTLQSRTGVFYQAMPAVGADGKNIMKLIPVQMVNGQFVQTQTRKQQTDTTPQKAVGTNIRPAPVQTEKRAALNPSASQQTFKQVSYLGASPNRVGLDFRNSLNKRPPQQETVNVPAKLPPVAALPTNCEKSASVQSHLPVTVKSPALPRGHYLQIPPNAQVRTVPASDLPPGIKKQILNSASSSPGSGVPRVVYVSPVTTVNQGVHAAGDSPLNSLKLLSQTSNTTSSAAPSKGCKRRLKLIPKVSQRPNSPIKWMIEEDDSTSTVDPVNHPPAAPERKTPVTPSDVRTEPGYQVIPGKSVSGQENALVMCNGKVFFVAKKSSLPVRMGKGDSPSKGGEFNKTTGSQDSVAPESRQDLSIVIPDESDEVIDLCDDDDEESAVPHLEEDNVIFVSYIPPKSESKPEQELMVKSPEKGSDHMETRSLSHGTEDLKPDSTASRDEISPLRGEQAEQGVTVRAVQDVPPVAASAVIDLCENDDSNPNRQQGSSSQRLEGLQSPADAAEPSTSDDSSGPDSHNTEKSSDLSDHWTKSRQMSDHLLRRMFNIIADVRVSLHRTDEASPGEFRQGGSIRSPDDHRRPTSSLKGKELCLQDFCAPQQTSLDNCEPLRDVTEEQLSHPPFRTQHTHTEPLECSHFRQNTNCQSALKCNLGESSLKAAPRVVDTEPGVPGYVEPIDEDILSTDENDIPNSQDTDSLPLTPACVDVKANTRRVGRARKRTICPCCIPGSQVPAVKSSAKTEEPEKPSWTAERTTKKGGRTKAARKDGKTSRKSCFTAKSDPRCKTHQVPAGDSVSTASADGDELRRHEQIQKVREILQEKDGALELLRKGMS